MKYIFPILFLLVFLGMIYYSIFRGCQVLREYNVLRSIYLTTTIVMFAFLIVGGVLTIFLPIPFAKTMAFMGHSSLIIFLYLIAAFAFMDIIRIANHFIHFAPEGMMAIRKWGLVVSIGIIGIAMIIGNFKFNNPKIVTHNLNFENKVLQNKELKIVAASDIHLGVSINKKRLNEYIELINEQKPDIILFAGDICDNALAPIIKQNMNEDLQKLKAPLGVYTCIGNHEYISRDVDGTVAYLQSGNINVLRDSATLVDDSFYIVGRDDRTNTNRQSIEDLLTKTDSTKPHILLDHQPYHLEEAEQNGINLQISGHTHDGQFFPVNIIVRNMYEIAHGYLLKGNTHYYISSGLGIWGPQYRIGSQSEIVVFNIKY